MGDFEFFSSSYAIMEIFDFKFGVCLKELMQYLLGLKAFRIKIYIKIIQI